MDDTEFLDLLYQQWSKTTWAENGYWSYDEITYDQDQDYETTFDVVANTEEADKFVGNFFSQADAEFVTAMHGCFPDLYRALLDAQDEAERADYDRDSRECLIAELEIENTRLEAELLKLQRETLGPNGSD